MRDLIGKRLRSCRNDGTIVMERDGCVFLEGITVGLNVLDGKTVGFTV